MDDLMPPMGEELNPVVYVSWYAARITAMPWASASRQKRNGKRSHGTRPKEPIPSKAGQSFSRITVGSGKIQGGLMHIAAEKTPIPMGSTTRWGMRGNGSLTVSAFISFATKTIRRDRKPVPIGCFVAVPGTILRTI